MNSILQFEFLANKDNNTLTIRREFAAERQLVWDCYTKQELLDQWFAPKPFTTKTKSMDFKSGGCLFGNHNKHGNRRRRETGMGKIR